MSSISSWKISSKAYTQPKNLLALGTHTENSASERDRHSFRLVQTERFYRLQTRNFPNEVLSDAIYQSLASPPLVSISMTSAGTPIRSNNQQRCCQFRNPDFLTSGLLDCFLCNSTLLKKKQKSRKIIAVNRKRMQKNLILAKKKTPGLLNCTNTLPSWHDLQPLPASGVTTGHRWHRFFGPWTLSDSRMHNLCSVA